MTKTIGIILFKIQDKKPHYLLLHHGGKYWNFAKGRQELGESEMQTAFREVGEEIGLLKKNIKLISGFRNGYIYKFKSKYKEDFNQLVTKESVFYLGQVAEGVKVKISHEHKNFGWFNYKETFTKLFYKNGQELLKKANKFILKQVM